jgi:hypothetical protein
VSLLTLLRDAQRASISHPAAAALRGLPAAAAGVIDAQLLEDAVLNAEAVARSHSRQTSLHVREIPSLYIAAYMYNAQFRPQLVLQVNYLHLFTIELTY